MVKARPLGAVLVFAALAMASMAGAAAGETRVLPADLEGRGVVGGSIEMPAESRRKGLYYVASISMELRLRRAAPEGRFKIGGSVNGYTANQVIGIVRDGRRCEGRSIELRSVDQLRGAWRKTRCGGAIRFTSRSFLQIRSRREGRSALLVTGEDLRKYVSGVRLLSSGVKETTRGPANLKIVPVSGDVVVASGAWEELPIRLVNDSERPIRIEGNSVEAMSEGISVRETLASAPDHLAAGRSANVHAWAKASSPGTYRVAVFATTSGNQPGTEFEVDVSGRESKSSDFLLIVAAVCAAAAFLILLGRRLILNRSEAG